MAEPVPTRREDPQPDGAPGATRREDGPVAGATRRESGSGSAWSVSPDLLPPALAARLEKLAPMRMAGGEAHLLRVTDSAYPSGERVLKVYFPGIEPDPQVRSLLASIRSPQVVDVVETGTLVDGRFYELMEYLPDGSLRDAGAGSRAFDPATVTSIVRQLAAGLGVLHARGITHRDLKPENVLIRAVRPRLDVVLTDFGLSRRLDTSAHFTTGARTSAYAAPEAWAGHVSPARDWWSLGIMVLELATGQQPFRGLDERVIQMTVSTKPVPVDAITDGRIAMLCEGLLVSDAKQRWSGTEIVDWLGGGSPPVLRHRVPFQVTPFEFDGQRYRDPEALAVAMAGNWRVAARRYGISPSPSWSALVDWLRPFNDPDRNPAGAVEARLDLLNQLESSTEVPNAKLLRLLAGLNPAMPPIYRQAHIDPAKLHELARSAQDGPAGDARADRDREIVVELNDGKLLEVLAGFAGGAELAGVADRWARAGQQLNAVVAELKRHPQVTGSVFDRGQRPVALAALLEFAAGAPCAADWLRELQNRARALPVRVAWFDGVLGWVGSDPIRGYAALHVVGIAQAEAQQVVMAQQAAERARLARQQAWADVEQRRLAGRGPATGTALGGAAVLAGLWLLVAVAAHTPLAVGTAAVVAIVHGVVEMTLANTIGADYHPRYSLLQFLQQAAGRVGSRMRGSPRLWLLGIIAVLVLLGFVSALAPVVAAAAGIGHAIWAGRRRSSWAHEHELYRQQVLSQ